MPVADRAVAQLQRAAWERATRQLRVCRRLLAALLLASCVRSVVLGLTVVLGVSEAITLVLLVAATMLTAQGRRLGPPRDEGAREIERRRHVR